MLVKIEFKSGSYHVVNAGSMFQSEDECRDAFLGLLEGGSRFFKLDDHQGRKRIINRENVNTIEFGYQRGAADQYRK